MAFTQGTSQAVSLTIAGAGRLGFYIDYSELSSAGTHRFYVTRTHGTTGAVGCTFTSSGDTHSTDTATLSWADGEADVKYIDVPVTSGDVSTHGGHLHRVVATLSSATGGAAIHKGSYETAFGIIDDGVTLPPASTSIFYDPDSVAASNGTSAEPYNTWADVTADLSVDGTLRYLCIKNFANPSTEVGARAPTGNGDQYTLQIEVPATKTSETERLTVMAWPSFEGGIDGLTATDNGGFYIGGSGTRPGGYTTLRKLTIRNIDATGAANKKANGLRVDGRSDVINAITMERCTVHDLTASGTAATGAWYTEAQGSTAGFGFKMWACTVYNTYNDSGSDKSWAFETYQAKAPSIQRCSLGVDCAGIYEKESDGANIGFSVAFNELSTGSIRSTNQGTNDNSVGHKVYSNILTQSEKYDSVNPITFGTEGTSANNTSDVWLTSNVVYNPTAATDGRGLVDTQRPVESMVVFNNIFAEHRCMTRYDYLLENEGSPLYQDYNTYYQGTSHSGVLFSYDLDGIYPKTEYSNITDQRTNTNYDDNSIVLDPAFTDAGSGVFTLQGASPAVGGGVSGTDMGVYLTGVEIIGPVGLQVEGSVVSSANIDASGNTLTIELSEVLTVAGGGLNDVDFSITGGGTLSSVTLDASGNTITATISPVVEAIDGDLTVTYTQPGSGLQASAVDIDSFEVVAVNGSTMDTTAPVLSSPIGIQTGTTTASGTVTTDEGNGTLYWEVTESATPPASGPVATITSKQDLPSEYGETTDPLGVSFSTTTDGSGSGATLTCTARTFDAGMQLYRVDQFTLNAGGTGYQVGDSLVMQLNFPPFGDYPSCTVATTSSNATFISDATSAGNTQTVSATGSQIVSVTGLSAATSYYIHFLHVDAASNESNVSTSAQFTTQALTAPTLEQGIMNPDLPVINSAGSTLTLTFSEAVTTSAATGLTLSTGETLTYSSGSTTDTIVYTISPYAQAGGGGEILNFAGGANVIEATVGGTDVEAFSDVLVSSQSTATAPVVVGDPTVDETGTVLTVVFSSASLANQTTPAYSPFTLTGTLGGVYTFTNASIPANTGVFTVSPAVEYNDVLSLSFTQAGGTFTDGTTGIELATFTDTVVNNTSATDNEPPIFTSDPAVSKTTVQGHTIRQTINETGNVYGVMVAADSPPPTPSQVKAGTDEQGEAPVSAKSVAAVAGQSCSFVFNAGEKNTTYNYYIVAEDSVPNLQAAAVKVTATTANLLFNGSGGKGLRPDEGSKKKVKMMWDKGRKK